jgi:hypothetical protein
MIQTYFSVDYRLTRSIFVNKSFVTNNNLARFLLKARRALEAIDEYFILPRVITPMI